MFEMSLIGNSLENRQQDYALDDLRLLKKRDSEYTIFSVIQSNRSHLLNAKWMPRIHLQRDREKLARRVLTHLQTIQQRETSDLAFRVIDAHKIKALKVALLAIARLDSNVLDLLRNDEIYKCLSTPFGDIQKFFNKNKLSKTHKIINEVASAIDFWEAQLQQHFNLGI